MKRSILLSLLIIGAAATLLGAGTFAVFSTMDSDSGELTAATLGITVEGTGASLAFSGSGTNCPDKLLPGDACTDTVTVTNTSDVDVVIKGVGISEMGALETCGDGDSVFSSYSLIDPDDVPVVDTILAPLAEKDFLVTATLEDTAGSDCQGKTATVTVMVTAEQVP